MAQFSLDSRTNFSPVVAFYHKQQTARLCNSPCWLFKGPQNGAKEFLIGSLKKRERDKRSDFEANFLVLTLRIITSRGPEAKRPGPDCNCYSPLVVLLILLRSADSPSFLVLPHEAASFLLLISKFAIIVVMPHRFSSLGCHFMAPAKLMLVFAHARSRSSSLFALHLDLCHRCVHVCNFP